MQLGDFVKLSTEFEKHGDAKNGILKQGEIGRIIVDEGKAILYRYKVTFKQRSYWYMRDALQKISTSLTFKVGDKVSYLLDSVTERTGDIVQIVISPSPRKYRVKTALEGRGLDYRSFQEDELCLVSDVPIWKFERFESISSCDNSNIANNGKDISGTGGEYIWYKGSYIPKRLNGTFRYEVQIVSISTSKADCFFGFGIHGIKPLGNQQDVADVYYYKSYRNPLQLYPSKQTPRFDQDSGSMVSITSGSWSGRKTIAMLQHCKVGDLIKCEYDKGLGQVTFYLNNMKVGIEKIPNGKRGYCFAPYAAARSSSTTFRLLSSSFTMASSHSTIQSFQIPGFNIKSLYNLKQRYSMLRAASIGHDQTESLVGVLQKIAVHYTGEKETLMRYEEIKDLGDDMKVHYCDYYEITKEINAMNSKATGPSSVKSLKQMIQKSGIPHSSENILREKRDESLSKMRELSHKLDNNYGSDLLIIQKRVDVLSEDLQILTLELKKQNFEPTEITSSSENVDGPILFFSGSTITTPEKWYGVENNDRISKECESVLNMTNEGNTLPAQIKQTDTAIINLDSAMSILNEFDMDLIFKNYVNVLENISNEETISKYGAVPNAKTYQKAIFDKCSKIKFYIDKEIEVWRSVRKDVKEVFEIS